MTTARDFFDRVRAASVDAEKCRTQLIELEGRALSLGSQGFEPRTKSTPDPQRMQGRVAAYVDMERNLRERMDADYALIDRACVVLYGEDERRGIDKVISPIWADILWWRYLACGTWDEVSKAVSYSVRQSQVICGIALRWVDDNSFASDIIGQSI